MRVVVNERRVPVRNRRGDQHILLVAPDGSSVMLMSDAGGGIAVSSLVMRFSASATAVPPNGSGNVRPAVEPCRVPLAAISLRPCGGSRGCPCVTLPLPSLTSGTFRRCSGRRTTA
jgi:hypothetical protein